MKTLKEMVGELSYWGSDEYKNAHPNPILVVDIPADVPKKGIPVKKGADMVSYTARTRRVAVEEGPEVGYHTVNIPPTQPKPAVLINEPEQNVPDPVRPDAGITLVYELEIEAGKSVSIGRAPKNDIHVPKRYVSKGHAYIGLGYVPEAKGSVFYILDQNSTNGTYLNGKKLEKIKITPLPDQGVLQIGTPEDPNEKPVTIRFLKLESAVRFLERESNK